MVFFYVQEMPIDYKMSVCAFEGDVLVPEWEIDLVKYNLEKEAHIKLAKEKPHPASLFHNCFEEYVCFL